MHVAVEMSRDFFYNRFILWAESIWSGRQCGCRRLTETCSIYRSLAECGSKVNQSFKSKKKI